MKSKKTAWLFCLCKIVCALCLFFPATAQAKFSIGLSGSGETSNVGLEIHRDAAVSASLSMDLGDYFQVSYVHRRSSEVKSGQKKSGTEATPVYSDFKLDETTITNGVNLVILLYRGQVTPYVFGGAARKDYYVKFTLDAGNEDYEVDDSTYAYVPSYGFGFGVYLSRDFTLKISQTFSPGTRTILDENDEEQKKEVLDTYTEVGINYNL